MDRYYFIAYAYGYRDFSKRAEILTKDQHPIRWLIEARKQEANVSAEFRCNYAIEFWTEISQDEYNRYHGEVG
jgi:hypothetical protein